MAVQELTKALLLMTELVNDDQSETVRELSEGVMRAIKAGLKFLRSIEKPAGSQDQFMAAELDSENSVTQMNRRSNKREKRSRSEDPNPTERLRRKAIDMKKIITDSPFGDGYQWRKYGQKMIQNERHPRWYYKCTYNGCNAKKKVQQKNSSYPPEFEVIFNNEHTCKTTVFSIPQLILPSPKKELQVIDFGSNVPNPRLLDGSKGFSTLTTDFHRSLVSFPLQDALIPNEEDKELALISPLSPAGQFYGPDASAYNGQEEIFDLMLPHVEL